MADRRCPYLLSVLVLFTAFALMCGDAVHAQDLSTFTIQADNDIFQRATNQAVHEAPAIERMPRLDCAIEYIRRAQGNEIVYRRGPIALRASNEPALVTSDGAHPAGSPVTATFVGGLLVDLARPGETAGTVPSGADGTRYMLRAAVIPQSYNDSILRAAIVLERAVVDVRGTTIIIRENEVFSRVIDIRGNEPLNFSMPTWEVQQGEETRSIPPALEEALLVTLETPRTFGFARNTPEPFSSSTLLTYAVPAPCNVSLRIRMRDGEHVLDEGAREPGVYSVEWNATDIPDGSYTASLRATDAAGRVIHASDLTLSKDHTAESWPLRDHRPIRMLSERFVVSTESGFAYQLPRDTRKPLRNMFTHIAVRVGYRISRVVEAGVLAGQDAFNERPAGNVDIDRISEYGGVVGYTYAYVGPYVRVTPWSGVVQPVAQLSAGFTDKGTAAEFGLGVRATLLSAVDFYLLPTVMMHLRSDQSTKLGLVYGASVRF